MLKAKAEKRRKDDLSRSLEIPTDRGDKHNHKSGKHWNAVANAEKKRRVSHPEKFKDSLLPIGQRANEGVGQELHKCFRCEHHADPLVFLDDEDDPLPSPSNDLTSSRITRRC